TCARSLARTGSACLIRRRLAEAAWDCIPLDGTADVETIDVAVFIDEHRGGEHEVTTFEEARRFLLDNRLDYQKACAEFRWPEPIDFNWAIDWFDGNLARNASSRD